MGGKGRHPSLSPLLALVFVLLRNVYSHVVKKETGLPRGVLDSSELYPDRLAAEVRKVETQLDITTDLIQIRDGRESAQHSTGSIMHRDRQLIRCRSGRGFLRGNLPPEA